MKHRQEKISIVTVTKNRPSFVTHLRYNIECLDYNREFIEWVIVDDGQEAILDYVQGFPNLIYRHSNRHIPLGKKRNFANSLASGEIIFNFDDDNYAFASRIRKAVEFFARNPAIRIVGSSEIFVLDIDIGRVYVAGPFAKNHATLGTWAFRRSLLAETRFVDSDSVREEFGFTKGWTIPIGQLDKHDTSISVDHGANTVSKKHLLREACSTFPLDEIITDDFSRKYFEHLIDARRASKRGRR